MIDKNKEKTRMYVLMCMLVCIWGLDYVVAKDAMAELDTLTLIFFKYSLAALFVCAIRLKTEKGPLFRRKDIWLYIICAIFGDILYFYCEYTAMDFMPISLISIVVTFVPVLSIAIDAIVYKRRTSLKIIIGVFICIFGVALIIGVDWGILLQGRLIGYLLAFACVFCWNVYNFVTAALHERYTTLTLTLNQLICTSIILAPYVLANFARLPEATPVIVGEVVYLGLISAGIGFTVQVRGLLVLGPTTSALFANFMPVTATFFSWLLLGEFITPIQVAGGIIVVATGYYVIKEKGKTI